MRRFHLIFTRRPALPLPMCHLELQNKLLVCTFAFPPSFRCQKRETPLPAHCHGHRAPCTAPMRGSPLSSSTGRFHPTHPKPRCGQMNPRLPEHFWSRVKVRWSLVMGIKCDSPLASPLAAHDDSRHIVFQRSECGQGTEGREVFDGLSDAACSLTDRKASQSPTTQTTGALEAFM